MTSFAQDLHLLGRLAEAAGARIMMIYNTDFKSEAKADASPVTAADTAAEAIIIEGLRKDFPEIPIIAEEQAAAGNLEKIGDRFFLVDPLDGTKEFISKNGEFTVNIGLIEHGAPVMGVVYAPALGELFAGAVGASAFRTIQGVTEKIETRPCPSEGPVVLASRSHRDPETEAFIAKQGCSAISNAGSSLKFCRVAEGKADLYPRFGRTMEWDTAAGHAVLVAAGGTVTNTDGSPFLYGKPGFANPAFIARGR
jgi:3'(2'), 5'-bisphosphate nucleotidase